MEVKLIDHTQNAVDLLLRTKNTRLQWDRDPSTMSPEEKQEHLDYMRDTIHSSWEFVSYTFEISEVSRAFTHQLVRTRTGSYAQESQRTVDARGNGFVPLLGQDEVPVVELYNAAMANSFDMYAALVDEGVPVQDARNVLPTGTFTSIIAKFSLRTLHDMALVRLCTRTQGEYQRVFKEMKRVVVETHPWAEPFIRVGCAQNGICLFPRYTACPIQELTYNGQKHKEGHDAIVSYINETINSTSHEARPVANKGRTM